MNLSTVSSLFKKTMQREKKIICDYYDTQKKYEVFFRRDNRSTSPQGKMRLYYENSQGKVPALHEWQDSKADCGVVRLFHPIYQIH